MPGMAGRLGEAVAHRRLTRCQAKLTSTAQPRTPPLWQTRGMKSSGDIHPQAVDLG
jgi:hypothetical protein